MFPSSSWQNHRDQWRLSEEATDFLHHEPSRARANASNGIWLDGIGTTVMVMLWYQWSNKNHCFQWTFHGHMVFWTGLQNDKVFRLALIWRWSRILLQRLHRTFPSLLGLLWSLEVIVLWIKLTHRGGLQVLRKDRRRMSLCQSFC